MASRKGVPVAERDAPDRSGPPPAGELDWGPPGPPAAPGEGPGDRPESWPPVSNARLGMWMLIATETMFFGGMVGAFLVLRLNAPVWPPPLQPRLPVGVTALNTVALLASSFTLARALRAIRGGDRPGLSRWLVGTALLGAVFLAVQGTEWLRLVHFGLTVSSGAYGGTFYTLIGTHGVHVLGALVWLVAVFAASRRGHYTAREHVGVATCAMYWNFVVALWPILYLLVYLL
jgi:heme/copper-type cytochrome/quinol oxidase subunit 3